MILDAALLVGCLALAVAGAAVLAVRLLRSRSVAPALPGPRARVRDVRVLPRSREEERLYAERHGFFWLPCPICAEPFGGHEWDGEGDDQTWYYEKHRGKGVCRKPECRAEARRRNAELYAGTPWHLATAFVPKPEKLCGKMFDVFGVMYRCNFEADHVGEDGKPDGCGVLLTIGSSRSRSREKPDGSVECSATFDLSVPPESKVTN